MTRKFIDDTGITYHVNEYNESRVLPLQLKVFFYIAVYGGLRRGEILALTWNDIDFEQNSISITKTAAYVNNQIINKKPKTKTSTRKVSLPKVVMNLIRQMHPDTPYNTFKKIIKRYNDFVTEESMKLPDIPLYGLRHTTATLLISQNMDIKTVSDRLVHAQTSTTMNIYAHSLKELDEKAGNVLEEILSQKKA